MYVTYGEYLQKYRKKREVERERFRERSKLREREERVQYENVCTCIRVYFAEGRSAGGATGAGKNVLRTLDITGSNVTRSRRERGSAFRRERRGEERGDGDY